MLHHKSRGLDVAVEIAERFQAELIVIHVDDTNLLRLAEYPFARKSVITRLLKGPQIPLIEFELRKRSRSLSAMSLLAKKPNRWSLRIARGNSRTTHRRCTNRPDHPG
jgi:hypothetical protein